MLENVAKGIIKVPRGFFNSTHLLEVENRVEENPLLTIFNYMYILKLFSMCKFYTLFKANPVRIQGPLLPF